VGNALELVEKIPGKFDLIFNDVDKHQYPDALRAGLPKLKRADYLSPTTRSGQAKRRSRQKPKISTHAAARV